MKDRFWDKVNKTNTCWLWTASSGSKGYGSFKYVKNNIKIYSAHRYAWFVTNGNIPDGLCVLHKCDIKLCVNPEHLFLGTLDDNNKDRANKGRSGKNNLFHENHPRSKLNMKQTIEIRALFPLYSKYRLAKMYGVSPGAIHCIITNQTWVDHN